MDTSIFEAFPNAIISGVWEIGMCQHGTLIGNQYNKIGDLDVVVDEGSNSTINTTPEALKSNLLIYVYPCQLPTLQTNALVSAYMLYNNEENAYYEIVDAGIGKNQHTGNIEHIELMVVQTEVTDA
jgi:hypothetical protein